MLCSSRPFHGLDALVASHVSAKTGSSVIGCLYSMYCILFHMLPCILMNNLLHTLVRIIVAHIVGRDHWIQHILLHRTI
jgi:hypothetical protein